MTKTRGCVGGGEKLYKGIERRMQLSVAAYGVIQGEKIVLTDFMLIKTANL